MKKLILTLLASAMAVAAFCQKSETLSAYIVDKTPTNVRSAPNGTVVLKLPNDCSYIVTLTSPRGGWWRLMAAENAEEGVDVALQGSPSKQYWVHSSVVGLSTRNYGGERLALRAESAEDAKAVYSFSEEITLIPLEVKGDWVKASTSDGKHMGWIELEWLCDNPLTNCS